MTNESPATITGKVIRDDGTERHEYTLAVKQPCKVTLTFEGVDFSNGRTLCVTEVAGHWSKIVPTVEGVYWWREEELDQDTDEPTGHWIVETMEIGPAGMARRFGSESYEKAHKWVGEWWTERIPEPPA